MSLAIAKHGCVLGKWQEQKQPSANSWATMNYVVIWRRLCIWNSCGLSFVSLIHFSYLKMKSRNNVFVSWTQRFCFSIAEEKWGNQYICFLNKDLSLVFKGSTWNLLHPLGVIVWHVLYSGCYSSKIIKLLQQHASTCERVHLSAISLELGDFQV